MTTNPIPHRAVDHAVVAVVGLGIAAAAAVIIGLAIPPSAVPPRRLPVEHLAATPRRLPHCRHFLVVDAKKCLGGCCWYSAFGRLPNLTPTSMRRIRRGLLLGQAR